MEYLQENLPTKTNFDLNQIKSPGKSQKIPGKSTNKNVPHGQRSGVGGASRHQIFFGGSLKRILIQIQIKFKSLLFKQA